ncbi:alpha/beta hydrolase [Comamonas composti]|uniref:alpha/beta hydrolase n=1 Tax=Comamonas composti TaxID=408558 RepID=UPI0004066D85|nr:alpha/beta hydrolase [Comamonas composti]
MSEQIISDAAQISQLAAPDGSRLVLHDWPQRSSLPARATVLMVHGLGEHGGRYALAARHLNEWGFAARSYDQYGHGLSDGPRGGLSSDTRLLDDLAFVIDDTRSRMPRGQPLVLLGHSMGGLVAALFVAKGMRSVDALVLSSPALAIHLSPVQKLMLSVLPQIIPNLRVANGLQVDYLSHDPAVCAAYRADSLCHDSISARLGQFLAEGGAQVQSRARHWCVPSLLLWAGEDRLVDPEGSRLFAAHAPADQLQSQCFGGAYHELFNESPELADPVWQRLGDWLDARFCASGMAGHGVQGA